MKLFIYVSNPEAFMDLDQWTREHSITATTSDGMEDHGWVLIQEIEIDVDSIDINRVRELALKSIKEAEQKERAEFEVKMQSYEERRRRLLAITHQPSSIGAPLDE